MWGKRKATLELSLVGNLGSFSEYNAEWEVPWSAEQSSHKGAENINKPHREEQQHKMVRKSSHRSPGVCHRGQELSSRLLNEVPGQCEREPREVPPSSPLPAFPAWLGWATFVPLRRLPLMASLRVSAQRCGLCLCLGRILTSSKPPGVWQTSFNVPNNCLWLLLLLLSYR